MWIDPRSGTLPATRPRVRADLGDGMEYHAAYLYYLRFDQEEGDPTVRAYEYFNIKKAITNPESVMRKLARNAYFDRSSPPCYARSVDGLFRRRKGYVGFAIDSQYHDISDENAITLKLDDGDPADHTFLNPKYVSVPSGVPGDLTEISVVYFENEMRRRPGSEPGDLDIKESEDFRIHFTSKRGRVVEDSGGTNMGPPVPPPNRRKRFGETEK